MNLELLHNEAIVLLDMWNLNDWTFVIGKRKLALGVCKYRQKVIEISEYHATHDSEEFVLDTLKHEIAHAITFLQFGMKVDAHGAEWKMNARKVGCSEQACSSVSVDNPVAVPPGKWYALCPTCKRRFDWYKKPKHLTGRYCKPCGRNDGSLTIVEDK